jgi:hypothetical protein
MPYTVQLPDRTEQLPTNWGEVTLGQAQRLSRLGDLYADVFGFLAVFLNCTRQHVMALPVDVISAEVLPALELLTTTAPDFNGFLAPVALTLPTPEGPRQLQVRGVEAATFGQAADIRAALEELAEDVPALRIRILAILMLPAYTGAPYDSDEVAGFEQVCRHAVLAEALPLTDFFLPNTTESGAPTLPTSKAFPSPATSVPPASKPSPRTGTHWPSWMPWPKATKPGGTSSSPGPGPKSTP